LKYQVKVLTPTLVGDGGKVSPIDYMVWRDQVNVLDQNRIFKLLSKGPRLEGYLSQLQKATKLDFASWGGFAQNYAGRRIPFEDAAYTPVWDRAPLDSLNIPTFASTNEGPFLPGTAVKGALRNGFVFANAKPGNIREMERQSVGVGGSDRMRVVSVTDSDHLSHEAFRIYMLKVSTLTAKGASNYALGWKENSRGSLTFAEMATPGTKFEGRWRENEFLNGAEVRQMLRWRDPVTRERLFEAANRYAEKQLQLHAQYAAWTGLDVLAASVADLQQKLTAARGEGRCLLALGWGAGFLSKSSAIGVSDEDYRKLLSELPYYERAIKSGMPFPKTRRIVFLKNKPSTLAGWVELSVF
jgi:CRISPR-associated protein Csm5